MKNDEIIQTLSYQNLKCFIVRNIETGKFGIKDTNGKIRVPFDFDKISVNKDEIIAKKGNEVYKITTRTKDTKKVVKFS